MPRHLISEDYRDFPCPYLLSSYLPQTTAKGTGLEKIIKQKQTKIKQKLQHNEKVGLKRRKKSIEENVQKRVKVKPIVDYIQDGATTKIYFLVLKKKIKVKKISS